MLNSHKLLYVLPDLAYIAELLPAKKELTFSIQAFRQINGEFIDDNELIPSSIEKLFSKLDKEEYHLILPDFLFTNTVVNVDGTSESAVLEHVNKVLLPDLELSKDTHEIQTSVLTSFKGSSKVQISAIEKSLLAPIRGAAKKAGVELKNVSPLTWTVKAIISLEPSISVLQMGTNLYVAQHYIGVDQASNFEIDDYDSVIETIKTLKGAESSIQSVYLVSGSLVEENLKEKLANTIPLQQLASFKEEDAKIPSYIKFIIESSMRTLSIPDFPVPQFNLGKATDEDMKTLTDSAAAKSVSESSELELDDEEKEEVEEGKKESSKKVETAPTDLPAPATAPAMTVEVAETESYSMTEDAKKTEAKTDNDVVDVEIDDKEKSEDLPAIAEIDTSKPETKPAEVKADATEESQPVIKSSNEIDLSQFANKDNDMDNELAIENEIGEIKPEKTTKKLDKPEKKVIKNSSGVNNMLKMVFITIAVFFITIAIGIGVGLGLLKMSENKAEVAEPTVVTQTPEPTLEPTPEPVVINKEELSILVVNATTKAGYAGTIKALLETAEITDVTASNASGEYETGVDYLLMTEENPDLQTLLEESTELIFKYSSEVDVEDPTGKYDAVIVLSK